MKHAARDLWSDAHLLCISALTLVSSCLLSFAWRQTVVNFKHSRLPFKTALHGVIYVCVCVCECVCVCACVVVCVSVCIVVCVCVCIVVCVCVCVL